MVDALEIGYAIKDRRAELGMTQAQLAEAAGVSKRCLWSLELGQNPSDEPQAEQPGIGGPAARDDASAGALSILTGGAR